MKISSQIQSFRLGITNNFLVKLQQGFLLVDTSYSFTYNRFLKELEKRKIALKEISYLILTHHHYDHAGFARKILAETQAKLIVHKNALSFLKLGLHNQNGKHWNQFIDQLLVPIAKIRNHHYPPLTVKKEDIIVQNDNNKILSDLGLKGKIITTPGHSNDSISLIFDNGVAIVGDAAMNLFKFGKKQYQPFFIQNENEILKSWKKLIKVGAKTLFPSHGTPFSIERLKKSDSFYLN